MKKIKIKFVYIFLFVIFAFLIFTNPSPESFRKALPILTNLLNAFFYNSDFSKKSIYGRKQNFIIFSLYKFQLNDVIKNNKDNITIELQALGIAGNFFVVRKEGL